MVLFFFCAVAFGQFSLGAAAICASLVWHLHTIRERCCGVLAPAMLLGATWILPSWTHCIAEAERCNWQLNVSDSVLTLVAFGCFLDMGRTDATAKTAAIELWWTNLGCAVLMGLAAARLAGVSSPLSGSEIVGRALFVTGNDTAFASIFALLCISRVTAHRGVLLVHAVGHAAFAVFAAAVAESRLVVALSLTSAATLVALATRADRRLGRIVSVAVVVTVTGAGIGLAMNDRLASKMRDGIDASIDTRAYLVQTALRLWRESPVFGRGAGAFELGYAQAHADSPPARTIDARFVPWPHNAIVELLLEKGVVGGGALLVAAGWLFRRAVRADTLASERFAAGRVGALVAALLFAALAVVETSIHRIYFVTGGAALVGALVPCHLQSAGGSDGHNQDSSLCRRIARWVRGVLRHRKSQ
jgi:O-antigen ligase